MNAVDFPLLGEPPDAHSLLATEVVRHTLSLPKGVSEYFATQGQPLELSGASMMALVLSRLAHRALLAHCAAARLASAPARGRHHIAEVRHQTAPARWPADELLKFHQPDAAG